MASAKPKRTRTPAKAAETPAAPAKKPSARKTAAPRKAAETKPAPAKFAPAKAAPRKRAPAKRATNTVPARPARRAVRARRTASPAAASAPAPAPLEIPPLLLEGDQPSIALPSGPGERYDLGPSARLEPVAGGTELPAAYGTRRLTLVARDPHWLFSAWDFTDAQLAAAQAASCDGHLVLRVFQHAVSGRPAVEQRVQRNARSTFVHVTAAGSRYCAQLGFYDDSGAWHEEAVSTVTQTPPDSVSADTTVQFETIPVEVPFARLLELVKGVVSENLPLVEALRELRAEGTVPLPELPASAASGPGQTAASAPWTPEQEHALAQVLSIDDVRRVWIGSLEITELLRRQLDRDIASQAAAQRQEFTAVSSPAGGLGGVSSPQGGGESRRGFWFNVNAELIIYGATEPDASVTLGGRPVPLRKDGTFSFRFALPDGAYALPVTATSADAVETREARLQFQRATGYTGAVGQHPQDPALRPPK
jgi:hypothetical protein